MKFLFMIEKIEKITTQKIAATMKSFAPCVKSLRRSFERNPVITIAKTDPMNSISSFMQNSITGVL